MTEKELWKEYCKAYYIDENTGCEAGSFGNDPDAMLKIGYKSLLLNYDIEEIKNIKLIDSSHDENDIRQNYIINNKYVLRINNADVFSEERFEELNRLIMRYRDYGIEAPLFIKDRNGKFLGKVDGKAFYLSEYLDGQIPPEELDEEKEDVLVEERLKLIAQFAEKYKGVDLSHIMSMYSLFDLSPYDTLNGIDEKQVNLNNLTERLNELGERELSEKLKLYDYNLRQQLLKIYQSLPKCVFQGDENWGNLIVDDSFHIRGLFDFNMAGTDVIVNYFANNALLIPSIINDDQFVELSTEEALAKLKNDFESNTQILKKYYNFTEDEELAYNLYAKIAVISIYPNECAIEYWLDDSEMRKKILALLWAIIS